MFPFRVSARIVPDSDNFLVICPKVLLKFRHLSQTASWLWLQGEEKLGWLGSLKLKYKQQSGQVSSPPMCAWYSFFRYLLPFLRLSSLLTRIHQRHFSGVFPQPLPERRKPLNLSSTHNQVLVKTSVEMLGKLRESEIASSPRQAWSHSHYKKSSIAVLFWREWQFLLNLVSWFAPLNQA